MLVRQLSSPCGLGARVPVFAGLDRELDRMLNTFLTASAPTVSRAGSPGINAYENQAGIVVECELPGMKIDDIDISLLGRELTIRGQRAEPEQQLGSALRRERPTGSFSRTLRLGVDVDANNVTASLTDGILTVTLPKAESARPRKIEISR